MSPGTSLKQKSPYNLNVVIITLLIAVAARVLWKSWLAPPVTGCPWVFADLRFLGETSCSISGHELSDVYMRSMLVLYIWALAGLLFFSRVNIMTLDGRVERIRRASTVWLPTVLVILHLIAGAILAAWRDRPTSQPPTGTSRFLVDDAVGLPIVTTIGWSLLLGGLLAIWATIFTVWQGLVPVRRTFGRLLPGRAIPPPPPHRSPASPPSAKPSTSSPTSTATDPSKHASSTSSPPFSTPDQQSSSPRPPRASARILTAVAARFNHGT